jgi:hypothetical protein
MMGARLGFLEDHSLMIDDLPAKALILIPVPDLLDLVEEIPVGEKV